MKWINLKNNRCPKCVKELDYEENHIVCNCGFRISKEKFSKICSEMVDNQLNRNNKEELNDL